MISHRYKCIFIHIPRCGGTSIERWIEDNDWWQVDPPSKHLLASQARALYAPYWDSYFKFALVRNPAERTRSMLKYAEHFGLSATQNGDQVSIDFTRYRKHFSCPNRGSHIIEHDHRFHKLTELDNGSRIPNSIYGNILDEDLDHIGRLEEITTSTSVIAAQIRIRKRFDFWEEKGIPVHLSWSEETRNEIHSMYEYDFLKYGYQSTTRSREDH